MRALLVAPDQEWLDERRRRGIDAQDEVWDGVLHVPPEPTSDHQRFEGRLERVLAPLVEARGLEIDLAVVAGPKLRIAWPGGSAEI